MATRFLHFKTYDNFKTQKLSANESDTAYTVGPESEIIEFGTPDVMWDSIAFVKDKGVFWTHGKLYDNAEDLSNYVISNNAELVAGGDAKSIAQIFGKDILASVSKVLKVITGVTYNSLTTPGNLILFPEITSYDMNSGTDLASFYYDLIRHLCNNYKRNTNTIFIGSGKPCNASKVANCCIYIQDASNLQNANGFTWYDQNLYLFGFNEGNWYWKPIVTGDAKITSLYEINTSYRPSTIDSFYKEGEVQVALAKDLDNNLLKGGDGIVISIPWINGQGTFGAQIIVDDDSPRMIIRNKIAGQWSDWYSLATIKETTKSQFNSIEKIPGVLYLIKD